MKLKHGFLLVVTVAALLLVQSAWAYSSYFVDVPSVGTTTSGTENKDTSSNPWMYYSSATNTGVTLRVRLQENGNDCSDYVEPFSHPAYTTLSMSFYGGTNCPYGVGHPSNLVFWTQYAGHTAVQGYWEAN